MDSSTELRESEIAAEQTYVTMLYERLDGLRESAGEQFAQAAASWPSTHQGRSERSIFAGLHAGRKAQLSAVERGLVIGRLDFDDSDPFYVGRVGLYSDEYDPMLIDWRAPAATAFYRATPAERLGVRRRRHIHLKGRRVVRLDDDVLDLANLDEVERSHLTGEAALLTSLESVRTGRMTDIVATIQAEQDRVIRSELGGILVVEGGPGTGKTVVALHRAAYLLYTHRDRLATRGVLVLGPNATFLRYIDQVLPGLGETEVVLSSVGGLYPGAESAHVDPPETAVVKGDLRMVDVVRQAVASYERAPAAGLEIPTGRDVHVVDEQTCRRIRDSGRERADRTGQPHNRVRPFVVRDVLDELTQRELDRMEAVLDAVEVPEEIEGEVDTAIAELLDRDAVRRELISSDAVREALDVLWPELTPEQVLADLLTDPELREGVAPELSAAERDTLQRADGTAWTAADVPLLDEIAVLVGDLDAKVYQEADERIRAEIERSAQVEEQRRLQQDAREVALEMATVEELPIPVDPELVLSRYYDEDDTATVVERAPADREWTYGHVIVDEAQELSPMAWRLLGRRCPTLSMTVVGDIAQTSAADGASSWSAVLDPLAEGRWRRAQLTINYRTTEPIMDVATDLLAARGADAVAPRSVRPGGEAPWSQQVGDDKLGEMLADVIRQERAALGDGTLAVVVPASRLDTCAAAARAASPDARTADDQAVLEAPVAILRPDQAKGLEFDGVVVVAPDEILAGSVRGHSDLYVALTRPTRRLGVVHTTPLPEELSRLRPVG